MTGKTSPQPDNTAIRTALWRALHLLADSEPHILKDDLGLKLAAPGDDWRQRPDMSPFTRPFRASILARARFVEDFVQKMAASQITQYVILGSGLDTFAFRHPELNTQLKIFELDQPGPQEWKKQRLEELNLAVPANLVFVPHDFESDRPWLESLSSHGFDINTPAVVASTGVSMYLTREANFSTLQEAAKLAPGSSFISSFMVPMEMVDPEIRTGVERAAAGAKANGTPWLSHFTPDAMVDLALRAGFKEARHISSGFLAQEYFSGRTDGLRPPASAEELLLAST